MHSLSSTSHVIAVLFVLKKKLQILRLHWDTA